MPYSFYVSDIVMTLSRELHISPFEVLQSDFDDFALLVNYYLSKPERSGKKEKTKAEKGDRIRVNDATATGGWF